VLYVNGIALGVLELKRSTVSVSEGIRQNLDNQQKTFIQPFFATIPLVMAGNDTEGLRYGAIEQVADWGIKRMKTRWGTCNITARRIWLNLELIKKPARCLEYIVVHELMHLLERSHNDRFKVLMDRHLPHWRLIRDELNRAPLGDQNDAF
jgi:predicted metal-dependent hydrolase